MRARATAVAVLVVAIALALSAVVLVALVGRTVRDTVTTAVETRVQEVAADLSTGAGATPVGGSEDGALVQVLRGDVVVAASAGLDGATALTDLSPAPGRSTTAQLDGAVLDEPGDTYQLVVLGVPVSTGADRVVAVQSLAVAEDAQALVGRLAAVGVPVLLLVVGLATWWSVGRALRPVEAIRVRTARIGAADLSARVPQPRTRDEIAALAATMNAMLARLETSAAAQRAFVSDAGHELRSPIAAIRAEIEVAQQVGTGPTTHVDVLAETARLERLVTDLLTLASADEGQGRRGQRGDVDIDDLLSAERARIQGRPGITVTTDIAPARAWGDRAALARVVRNLVDNAVRHSAGRIHLACGIGGPDQSLGATGAGDVWLRVEDDGPGVPAGDRERVFDRFVRLDEARARDEGGAGLGLAIVRQTVAAHSGHVGFGDAGTLPGAQVTVRLPGHPPAGSSR
jgi:signal transduction histidine kinase